MRKIKFRAWDEGSNRMIFQHDMNCVRGNKEYYFSLYEESVELLHYDEDYSAYVNCDAELMQYIGLKDSNKNEIYKGDIVKIEDYFGDDIIGRVIYDETTAGYVFHKGNERNYFQMTLDLESYVYYVIGNIYENTELLEEVMETH